MMLKTATTMGVTGIMGLMAQIAPTEVGREMANWPATAICGFLACVAFLLLYMVIKQGFGVLNRLVSQLQKSNDLTVELCARLNTRKCLVEDKKKGQTTDEHG